MIRKITLLLILCTFLVADARAFTHRLSSEQVREAYFIGRDPEKRQSFFDKYIHYPKPTDTGPGVHLVEFRTPYELVARRSQEHWANYNGLEAEKEYDTYPDEVIVRVLMCGTSTYRFAIPPQDPAHGQDYLRGFDFRVSQAASITYRSLTLLGAGCANSEGVEALLHFDADQFAPGDVKIEVVAPGGQAYSTRFDLDQLQ
jgi:hypothetical protein